jgi:heat-inducible transcriptional repressor
MAHDPVLDERRTRVLRAVVRDHIRTGEPVGSGSLARRYGLNVSPATIRNDMAVLEELGYVTQPHTSAGRIPTDAGYRFFVDTLPEIPSLSQAQRRAVTGALDERVADVEDLMRRTAHVLAEMTHYAAVALPPLLERGGMVRADLVPVGSGSLLLVVTDTGRVDRLFLELTDAEAVRRVSSVLAEFFGGLTYAEARDRARAMAAQAPPGERQVLAAVAEAFGDLDLGPRDEHVFIGGVANIAGEDGFERRETLRRVFEALDEEATILRFLHRLAAEEEGDLTVRIGHENRLAAMREASVVVARYETGGEPGTIAVIGPTRMEYPAAMSAARAVAERLSRVVRALGR